MYWSKRVLRSFVSSILPQSMLGGNVCISEQGYGSRLTDLISLVFWYAFAFHSHPTRTSAEAHLPTVLPSPLPVVAFQCKWVDEWLQLVHQKTSPAEGPWWLRFSQATPPLPSPTQHFVLTPLPPVSAYSLHPTWRGWLGTRGLKENWYSYLPLRTTVVSMKPFLKVAINPRHSLFISGWQRLVMDKTQNPMPSLRW